MKKNLFILHFILYFIASCNTEQRNVKIISTPLHGTQYWKGESLHMSDTLGNPAKIYCFDSLFFLRESSDERKMIVCDLDRKIIINQLIPKGRGPGEQIGTFMFSYNPANRKIYSFDITLRQVLEINIDSVHDSNYKPIQSYHFPDSLNILRADILNDSTFIATGNFNDCRIATFTLNGKIQKMGESPDLKHKMNDIINQAYTGAIKSSPDNNKFLIACRYADQLEIFNINDKEQLYVKGPELFEPDYKIKKMGSYSALAHGKDERFGYTDVYVTNERIYALYSGKKQGQENDLYSNSIRVFSWTGEYLVNYELDREIMTFCVDDNGHIYGITTEPGAEIYKFKSVNS